MDIDILNSIKLSLIVGVFSTVLAFFPALICGWILARKDFIGKSFFNILVFFPMVSPPAIVGLILLRFLGRNSFLGKILSSLGLQIPFTTKGAILASAVVGFPLFVMFVRSTFMSIDKKYEEYALTAGYKPSEVFLKVLLPLSYPGLIAGAIVCFARSLGEFGATIILAGNIQNETQTLSLAIYSLLDSTQRSDQINFLILSSLSLSFISLLIFEYMNHRFWKKIEWK